MFFDFEKLDGYPVAFDFVVSADEIAHKPVRGRTYVKYQLLRIVAMLTSLARLNTVRNPNLR
jgi:hypothetical protein